ncbi:hypothetical protein ACOME3_000930 [Neoechinorhynchus agilis]
MINQFGLDICGLQGWYVDTQSGPGYVWLVDDAKNTISFVPIQDAPMCVLARVIGFSGRSKKELLISIKNFKMHGNGVVRRVFEFMVGAKNQFIDGLKSMLGGMKKLLTSWQKAEDKLDWTEGDMVLPVNMDKQTIPARSGAEHDFQPVKKSSYRRVAPPKKIVTRAMKPEADLSLIDIINNLSKSIAKVSTEAGNCHALAIGPRTIVVPLHLIPDHGTWFSLSFPWLDTILINIMESLFSQHPHVYWDELTDSVALL